MTVLDVILQAEAAGRHSAVRRTAFRHRHLSNAPLVVCAYNLSGEAAGPLGFVWGTDPASPSGAFAAEPRNRDIRFAAINRFAAAFADWIRPFLVLVPEHRRDGNVMMVAQATPQIVFPNSATRDYVTARLGRSLRYLGLGATFPVPEPTQWAGSHLSWMAEHARFPGQSVVLAATELLRRHYATGQSALEDENLATLLAWIENEPGSGLARIRRAEDEEPPYGPVPDPDLETRIEPWVRGFSQARREEDAHAAATLEARVHEAVREPLLTAYAATHRALTHARSLTAAGGVATRNRTDLLQWSAHARQCAKFLPRFKKRHDPLRAARMLETWSHALEELDACEAFDDPLVMATYDADGLCVSGEVTAVDLDHKEVKSGNKRATQVPLVDVHCPGGTRLLPEMTVVWAGDRSVKGEIRDVVLGERGADVQIAILAGHKSGERIPKVSDSTVYAALDVFGGRGPDSPDEVPWTHRPPPDGDGDRGDDGDPTDVGTDLGPIEVLDAPSGTVGDPDDVPGVVT
jgi:hypothetical protein